MIRALTLACMLGAVPVSQAMTADLTKLNNELEIMSGVVNTALKQENGDKGLRYRSIQASYLANQGVVFEISTGGNNFVFSDLTEGLVEFFPSNWDAPGDGSFAFEFSGDVDWEEVTVEAMHEVQEGMAQLSEHLRELKEQGRELSWESREYERELRDLKFRLRAGAKDEKEELDKEAKAIEKAMAQIKEKEVEIKEKVEKFAAERKKRAAIQKEAREKAYKSFLSNFESSIGNALCSFGGGLRALPNDEYISFVLKNFSIESGKEAKDRVYVFSNEHVRRCVQDKIKAEALLSKADVYEF